MRLDYRNLIKEEEQELLALEKKRRYSQLMQRVKMLRLLKSGDGTTLTKAAQALDYSHRPCHRWFNS